MLKSLALVIACEGNAKSKTFVHLIAEASGKELIVVSGSEAHGDLSRTDSCSVEPSFSPIITLLVLNTRISELIEEITQNFVVFEALVLSDIPCLCKSISSL